MISAIVADGPIYSDYGSEEDLAELIELFVEELPDRLASLRQAFDGEEWDALYTVAHQLKGALGGYGFLALVPYAAALEAAVRGLAQREDVAAALESFAELCNRVRAGSPPATPVGLARPLEPAGPERPGPSARDGLA
jgi:HPt (histidine-containing phosphotransfer) domain-containing protein